MRAWKLAAWSIAWALLDGACGVDCPPDTVQVGSRCAELPSDGDGTGNSDSDGTAVDRCGNGALDKGEDCDPGAGIIEGCAADCSAKPGYGCNTESFCELRPPAPAVRTRGSHDPDHVVIAWDLPASTIYADVFADDEPAAEYLDTQRSYETQLAEGRHKLAVRACTERMICSEATAVTVQVKRFGAGYGPWYRGVARSFTRTALGHVTPVTCRKCLAAPDGSPRPYAEARPNLATALADGADFIDIDLVSIDGMLMIAGDDGDSREGVPSLDELLADPLVVQSDAPLVIEVHEVDRELEAFAEALWSRLEAAEQIVRNGRPLFLRKGPEVDSEAWVQASYARAQHPLIAPYVRFVETGYFDGTPGAMFALRADTPELFSRLSAAREHEVGVWVDAVPDGNVGELTLGGLREFVDGLFASEVTERARALVQAKDAAAFVDAFPLLDANGSLPISAFDSEAMLQMLLRPLGNEAVIPPPMLVQGSQDGTLPGGLLDFSAGNRALALTEEPIALAADEGVLVSTTVVFDEASLSLTSGAATLLGNLEAGGFGLEVTGASTGAVLSFAVHSNGTYRRHQYPVRGDEDAAGAAFAEPLTPGRAYWIAGSYRPGNHLSLFIDGRLAAGTLGAPAGAITSSAVPVVLGANPGAGDPPALSAFFRGRVQNAQVLRKRSGMP